MFFGYIELAVLMLVCYGIGLVAGILLGRVDNENNSM